jgi:peptidoglycan/LPS O-acetylase OafA/YrhL
MSSIQTTAADLFDQQENSQVVDALRGYAILLVILAHATPYIPELVWPVKRVFLLGVYGVQLFFIASALTLLMSWQRSRDPFRLRSIKFFIRRFFRIAPLYFLAIPFYWIVKQRTAADFDLESLLATLLFFNAWSPYYIPTVPGWMPVPGGWSIGVEFCFYIIFPLLVALVYTLRRSLVFLIFGLILTGFASNFGANLYPELSGESRSNFLYFWPLNQLVIFSFGFLLYYLVKSDFIRGRVEKSSLSSNHATAIMLIVVFVLSFYGQQKFFDLSNGKFPTHVIISVAFMAWALVLLVKQSGWAINQYIVKLGQVSFSAYVLHFAMLQAASMIVIWGWHGSKDGMASVPYAGVVILVALALTYLASVITYRFIEQPFIRLGKRLSASQSKI